MKSYMVIDEVYIRGKTRFVIGELEIIPVEDSRPEDYASKPTDMTCVLLSEFKPDILGRRRVKEGDIFVVEQSNGIVHEVCYKDKAEKARRIKAISQMTKR